MTQTNRKTYDIYIDLALFIGRFILFTLNLTEMESWNIFLFYVVCFAQNHVFKFIDFVVCFNFFYSLTA